MRNYKLFGKVYGEKEINILKEYDKYMSNIFADKAIVTKTEVSYASKEYRNAMEDSERKILEDFIIDVTYLSTKRTWLSMAFDILFIVYICFLSSSILKLICSIVIAGKMAKDIALIKEKYIYNKIMDLLE